MSRPLSRVLIGQRFAALALASLSACGWSGADRERYVQACQQGYTPPPPKPDLVLLADRSGNVLEYSPAEARDPALAQIGYLPATPEEVTAYAKEQQKRRERWQTLKAQCGCFQKVAESWTRSFDDWSARKNRTPASATIDQKQKCGF